jgi:gliding motility-associated-like protein
LIDRGKISIFPKIILQGNILSKMVLQIRRIILLLCISCLFYQALFSQSYSSKNNYTGAWETSSSWNPIWPVPQTNISGYNITINGYITLNSSLLFSGASGDLIINDTLVIKGDLSIRDKNALKVNDNGILIVRGNLIIDKHADVIANGYLIVTGNIVKGGPNGEGSFTSSQDPVMVFVGGTIPSGLTDDNHKFPALNCTAHPTARYPNSTCSYGNMADLMNDPIYPFFLSTCSTATPTITAGGPTSFCAGGSVTLTSSAGSAYLWSNGATTQSIVVTTSGSYSVRITNSTGCQSLASIATTVTVNSLPVSPTITAGGPVTFCSGGSVNLTSSTGNTYLWSTGATTASINVTISGSYTVRVTNSNGCQSAVSSAINVTVNSLPIVPTITAGGPTTFCAGGSVTLTSSAGTSYLWSNGATTPGINVTTSGSYTVRVTNVPGCQSAVSSATAVTVNALPVTPVITAGGPTTFCAGGSVTLTSSTGTGYLWSNGAVTPSINVTTPGSFTVKITNANGCQSASSVATIVNVNALPTTPVITAGGPTTFCAGGSVTLTSSPETSYSWSDTEISQGIFVTTPGSYTVRVTNSNGCQSALSTPTVVTINALPVVNAGTGVTIPNGTSTTIDATVTGTGPFTYSWSPAGQLVNALIEDPTTVNLTTTTVFTLTATSLTTSCSKTNEVTITISGGPLSSTPTASPATVCSGAEVQFHAIASGGSGSYTYTWTSTPIGFVSSISDPITYPSVTTTYNVAVFDGFSTVNSQVTVTVNDLPATPAITAGGPTTFCTGGGITLTSSPGTTYLWSTGQTSASVNISTTGSYTVRVTNSSGCQSVVSASAAVTVNALPATPIITASGPTIFCDGGNITLTSSPGTTYLWSTGATTASIIVTNTGSYSVQVTNTNGCQSAPSAATTVTVNTSPVTPIITAGGPTTFCDGGSVTLTSNPGTSYLWSNGAITPTIDVNLSGSYSVRVSNANGCQSALSVPIIVTVNNLPPAPTITAGGPTTFCTGSSVTLTSGIGTSYLWSTGAVTSSINVTSTGSYTIRVTDANGCQSAASSATVITVNSLPFTPTITAGGPTTFCAGGNVILTSSSGSSYLWSNGATTQNVNITSSGGYSIQVTSAEGCQSASSNITVVTVNDLPLTPTLTADGPTSFCDGSSINLTSGFGTGYLWSDGATSQSINVANSGSYTIQTSDINGCMSNSSPIVKVTVNAIPQVNISSSSSSLCISDQRSLTGNPSGGTFTILSGPGTINGNILSATGTGTINLEYFYDNGCSNKATQSLSVDDNVVANAGPDQKLLYVFETQMAAVFPQYGIGEWSLVSGSADINDIQSPTTRITGLSIGENKFLWKAVNGGCESTDEIVIDVSDIVTPTVITPNEDGLNDELIFPGLQAFPGSSIMIYNRWGSEVYRNSDYRNDWKGKDKNKRDLQPDTYYYVLKISNGRILKGFIDIRR